MKDKIRKLLALAADPNAQGAEAETAGRMAAKLMAKHDIDLADLQEDELRKAWDMTRTAAQGCRPGKKNAKEVPPWIGIIAWGVKVYTKTRVSNGFGIVYFKGPREDTELSKWLHEYLLDQCYAASKGLGLGDANRFRNGFAAACQRRLKVMSRVREDSDREDRAGSTALVRVQDAREAEMNLVFGHEDKAKSSAVGMDQAGYAAGLMAAIPTAKPIGAESRHLLGN